MQRKWLIVADVDGIQEYVFGPSRLRAVRGASALVDALGVKLGKAIGAAPGGECLRTGGGQVVGMVPSEDEPVTLRRQMESMARQVGGPALSVTTAAVPYDGGFQQSLRHAFIKVGERKDGLAGADTSPEALASGGFVRHCDLCQRYPAQAAPDDATRFAYDFGGGQNRSLCESCWRRVAVRMEDIAFDRRLLRAAGATLSALPFRIEDLWRGAGQAEGRYMAMLAADGNGIGQLLEHIDDRQAYRDFSAALDQVGVDALAEAVKEEAKAARQKGWTAWVNYLPLMPIISGGDDYTVLMPAEYAFEFAGTWLNAFARLSEQSAAIQGVIQAFRQARPNLAGTFPGDGPTWPLTLAAGIAIAKPNFPIAAYHRLARALRSNAKRAKGWQATGASGGGIDFAAITTANAEDLTALRQRYRFDGAWLTSRPYTATDYACLLELSRAWERSGVPRSRSKWLTGEFWRGRRPGCQALRSIRDRLDEPGTAAATAVKDALAKLGCSLDDPFVPSGPSAKAGQTPLIDALEILELIGDKE